MAKLGYPEDTFKARHSWDYLRIEPVVLQYIEIEKYPNMVIRDKVEEYVRENINMAGIDEVRFPKCISQALHLVGYEKRSVRGKSWDKVLDETGEPVVTWSIRAADPRDKSPERWRVVNQVIDAFFSFCDDHIIKTRKRSVREHNADRIVPLTTFINL